MKFLRKYVLSIISIFILVGWYGYCVNWDIQNDKKLYESEMKYYQQECKKDVAVCVQKPQLYKMDTLGQMFYTIGTSKFRNMILIFIVFITVPGLYQFYKELHSGYIKNILIRKKYSTYMKEKIVEGVKKTVFITPIVFAFCFFITFTLCDGIVDINYTFSHALPGTVLPEVKYLSHPYLFCITFIFNFVLLTCTCLNIGFICIKKSKNFALSTLLSLLVYFLLNIVCNVGIGTIFFRNLLKIRGVDYYISPSNLVSYNAPSNATSWGMLYMIFSMLCLMILSLIIFYFSYKDKEKVMIEIEK